MEDQSLLSRLAILRHESLDANCRSALSVAKKFIRAATDLNLVCSSWLMSSFSFSNAYLHPVKPGVLHFFMFAVSVSLTMRPEGFKSASYSMPTCVHLSVPLRILISLLRCFSLVLFLHLPAQPVKLLLVGHNQEIIRVHSKFDITLDVTEVAHGQASLDEPDAIEMFGASLLITCAM